MININNLFRYKSRRMKQIKPDTQKVKRSFFLSNCRKNAVDKKSSSNPDRSIKKTIAVGTSEETSLYLVKLAQILFKK